MQNQVMRMTVAHLPLMSSACLLAACFTQAPLPSTIPAPETRIVAQMTDTGVLAMSNAIGAGATAVEGIVAGADATSWDLRMIRVDYRNGDRKSTRLNSSHITISYAVCCLKK